MSAYDTLLAALDAHGSRREGANWRCPAHEDRRASLSVTRAREGVLVHCHAGCATADVLAALGLTLADLFDRRNGLGDPEAIYSYGDEQSRPLFEVVRFPGKQFRQRRPDGSWGLGDTRRVLYRLPRILAAVEAGETIYIVEGEKDVHAIERAGGVATCNPMGAGKWRDEYAECLRGAVVVIVADRDDAGRKHAAAVARSLAGIAASVMVVEPAEGKDAADHLAAGHGLGDFVAVVEDAVPADEPEARPSVMTARAICSIELPDASAEDLLGAMVRRGQRIVIGAHTGHGKTTLATQMVRAVTGASDCLGYTGIGGVRALILDAEQGLRTVQRRLREAGLAESVDVDYLRVPDGLALDRSDEDRVWLRDTIDRGGYALVAADPAYKLHRADQNDERDVVDLLRIFDGWREDLHFGLILPAHARKPHPRVPFSMNDISGSTAWCRGAEVVLGLQFLSAGYSRLHIWKDRDGDLLLGARWGLIFDRERGFVRDMRDGGPDETRESILAYLGNIAPAAATLADISAATEVGRKAARARLDALVADELVREDEPVTRGGRRAATWSTLVVDETRWEDPA